jgi:hypothetical protein
MADQGIVEQDPPAATKNGRVWPFVVTILVAVISSVTSIGLQAWTSSQASNQQEEATLESRRYAYKLFISEARLTEHRLTDVRWCQYALDDLTQPVPKAESTSPGLSLPRYIGTPVCDGVTADSAGGLPAMRAAYERVHAIWVAGHAGLAEPRKEMIKYASQTAIGLVDVLYRVLGSLTEYEHHPVDDDFARLDAELCREFPEECRPR